ncbi:hypothetical protein [Vibrio sp. ER1A]|uniref:hypothetical protein n=1 Tax=Vibrio sp. ER1A TaxID=1517681 RepID=UPI0004DCD09D|nr:hypothetical protein [Vibrio sp. ER1A]KFA99611.1 hypothetical protein HW45_02685 [Vibrio sp. ER1A]
MANVIGSFRQGFQATNDVFDRANDIEDRKTLRDRQDTAWNQRQEDRALRLEDRKDNIERRNTLRDREDTAWNQGQEDRARTIEQGNKLFEQNSVLNKINIRNAKYKEATKLYQDSLETALGTGDMSVLFSPEFIKLGEDFKSFDLGNKFTPEAMHTAGLATNMLNGLANGQPPPHNSKDVIAVQKLVFPETYSGYGVPEKTKEGKTITSIEPAGLDVSPDGRGLVALVKVTDEDGKSYTAPVTEGRTTDDNDHVKVIPFENAVAKLNSIVELQRNEQFATLRNVYKVKFGKGKSDNKTANENRSELFKESNRISAVFEKQREEARKDAQLSQDSEALQQRLNQIDLQEKQAQAQLELRYQNLYDSPQSATHDLKENNDHVKQALGLYKDIYPNVQWDPETEQDIKDAIQRGWPQEKIQRFIDSLISSNKVKTKALSSTMNTTDRNINPALTEGLTATQIMQNQRNAENNEYNFPSSERYQQQQDISKEQLPQPSNVDEIARQEEIWGR